MYITAINGGDEERRERIIIESVDSISRDGLDTPICTIHYKMQITHTSLTLRLLNFHGHLVDFLSN